VSVVDGCVFTQGHAAGEEMVIALEEATGREFWRVAVGRAERVAYPGGRSTPTVEAGRLYVETVAGDVACLEAKTGRIAWRKNLKQDFGGRPGVWGYAESPLVDGERVVVTPGGEKAALVALDKRNGNVIWRATIPPGENDYAKHERDPYCGPSVAAYASVIVAEVGGIRQYVQFLQQGVGGVRAEDGAFLWRESSSSNPYANCPTPVVHAGYVFSSSGFQGGSAALVELVGQGGQVTPRLVYTSKALKALYGGFVLVGGHVYGCSEGAWVCMDFATGAVAWKERSVGMGSVVFADGHLYLRGDSGTVALVEATPQEYREKGRFGQPDRSKRPARSYPVVTGGRLYLRDDNTLLCYCVSEKEGTG
jgi:outer membrane protein assembly factor BamB